MLILSTFFLMLLVFFIFRGKAIAPSITPEPRLTKFTLALDWTPNTNHTGIYVAQNKGYFKEEGLDVEILPFSSQVSPDLLVGTGKADIGISSTEWIVADSALGAPVISIAAIIQYNTSVLLSLERPDIKRPKDFSGKIYGGFGAPFEEAVVNQIIKTDGGRGAIKNVTLDTEGLKALESKRIDFVWGYAGWEAIAAKKEGYKLNAFPITSFGIPDYYSPVFITSKSVITQKTELLSQFMKALSRGYEFARENPAASAGILISAVPKGTFPDEKLVYESQEYLSPRYAQKGRKWGLQDKSVWQEFSSFILDAGIIKDKDGKVVKSIDPVTLFTNDFLPK